MTTEQDMDGLDFEPGDPGTDDVEQNPAQGLDSSGFANDTGNDAAGVGGTAPGPAGVSGREGSLLSSTTAPTDNFLAPGSPAGSVAQDTSAVGAASTYEGVEIRTFSTQGRAADKGRSGSGFLDNDSDDEPRHVVGDKTDLLRGSLARPLTGTQGSSASFDPRQQAGAVSGPAAVNGSSGAAKAAASPAAPDSSAAHAARKQSGDLPPPPAHPTNQPIGPTDSGDARVTPSGYSVLQVPCGPPADDDDCLDVANWSPDRVQSALDSLLLVVSQVRDHFHGNHHISTVSRCHPWGLAYRLVEGLRPDHVGVQIPVVTTLTPFTNNLFLTPVTREKGAFRVRDVIAIWRHMYADPALDPTNPATPGEYIARHRRAAAYQTLTQGGEPLADQVPLQAAGSLAVLGPGLIRGTLGPGNAGPSTAEAALPASDPPSGSPNTGSAADSAGGQSSAAGAGQGAASLSRSLAPEAEAERAIVKAITGCDQGIGAPVLPTSRPVPLGTLTGTSTFRRTASGLGNKGSQSSLSDLAAQGAGKEPLGPGTKGDSPRSPEAPAGPGIQNLGVDPSAPRGPLHGDKTKGGKLAEAGKLPAQASRPQDPHTTTTIEKNGRPRQPGLSAEAPGSATGNGGRPGAARGTTPPDRADGPKARMAGAAGGSGPQNPRALGRGGRTGQEPRESKAKLKFRKNQHSYSHGDGQEYLEGRPPPAKESLRGDSERPAVILTAGPRGNNTRIHDKSDRAASASSRSRDRSGSGGPRRPSPAHESDQPKRSGPSSLVATAAIRSRRERSRGPPANQASRKQNYRQPLLRDRSRRRDARRNEPASRDREEFRLSLGRSSPSDVEAKSRRASRARDSSPDPEPQESPDHQEANTAAGNGTSRGTDAPPDESTGGIHPFPEDEAVGVDGTAVAEDAPVPADHDRRSVRGTSRSLSPSCSSGGTPYVCEHEPPARHKQDSRERNSRSPADSDQGSRAPSAGGSHRPCSRSGERRRSRSDSRNPHGRGSPGCPGGKLRQTSRSRSREQHRRPSSSSASLHGRSRHSGSGRQRDNRRKSGLQHDAGGTGDRRNPRNRRGKGNPPDKKPEHRGRSGPPAGLVLAASSSGNSRIGRFYQRDDVDPGTVSLDELKNPNLPDHNDDGFDGYDQEEDGHGEEEGEDGHDYGESEDGSGEEEDEDGSSEEGDGDDPYSDDELDGREIALRNDKQGQIGRDRDRSRKREGRARKKGPTYEIGTLGGFVGKKWKRWAPVCRKGQNCAGASDWTCPKYHGKKICKYTGQENTAFPDSWPDAQSSMRRSTRKGDGKKGRNYQSQANRGRRGRGGPSGQQEPGNGDQPPARGGGESRQ